MTEIEAIEELKCYRAKSGTEYPEEIKMAISVLEKQVSKKIIFNSENDREYEDYICPNCKDILQQRRKGATGITIHKFKYCHNCGQMLDWSDTD